MINWIVSSSALILIIIALRYILRGKILLRLQYALWLIVLVRLLLPFEIGSLPVSMSGALDQIPVVQEIESMEGIVSIEQSDDGSVWGFPDTLMPDNPVEVAPEKTEQEFTRMMTVMKVRDIAAPLWKTGIVVCLIALLSVNLNLSRRIKKNRTVLCEKDLLTVYVTDQVETPCLFGLFSPAVYVTPEAASDETVLRHTVEHEYTHFRHGDHIWALLRCMALAVHWYNPLVWWAAKLSRDDGELACDEAVIRRLGENERSEYGRTLIGMTCKGRSQLLTTATTMTGSKNTLKERISLIAKKPKMAAYTLIAVLLIAVLTTGFAFSGTSASSNHKLHHWMQNITEQDITHAFISEGYGSNQRSYTLTNEFKTELVGILNAVEWKQLDMDQTAGAHERRLYVATGDFLEWEDEFIFGCHEDGRLSVSFNAEFGEEISEPGRSWWVTSPELYRFINDVLDGKTAMKEDAEYLRADLDFDGEDENIRIITNSHNQIYTLQVVEDDDTVIWEGEAAIPHMGWTTYMLYQDGTSRGILHYTPAVGQGFAGYNYQVIFLDGRETPDYLKGEVSFPLPPVEENSPFADYEYDPREVIAFLEDINYLMTHSVVLLSTEGGQLIMGPQSTQFLIDDNIELIRQLSGQTQQPYDVADEMKKVKASDITELGTSAFTADEIASALNAAASNKITAGVASNRGFSSENYLFWDETAYIEGDYETGVSGYNLAFRMKCGLAENIVKVTYGTYNNYSTGYFESEKLYNLLRYRNQAEYGEIDQEAFDKFRHILTNQMEHYFNVMSESQPISSYELIEFNKVWSYEESDGAVIDLYNFDYGLLTDDPEGIMFAGGMRLDGWLRLRSFNGGGQFAVRFRDGSMTACSFMANDFWYDPAYPELEKDAKEYITSALDNCEDNPGNA